MPKHLKFTSRTPQRIEQLPWQIQNHVTRRNLVVSRKMFPESFRQNLPHSRCALSRPHHSQERLRLADLRVSRHRQRAKVYGMTNDSNRERRPRLRGASVGNGDAT